MAQQTLADPREVNRTGNVRSTRWSTLVVASVTTYMLFLDLSAVSVALPAIQRSLHATLSGLQWVFDAYALSLAAFLVTAGAIADRRGRRLVFLAGLVIFTAASMACGLAGDVTALSVSRGPGGDRTTGRRPISSTMTRSARRTRAMALLTVSSARCRRSNTPRSSRVNQATLSPASTACGRGLEQERLAGAGSDGDRLQHLRSVLPCEVRVTGSTHPLFGQLLWASGFTRLNRVLNLIVGLPDGSPGTIRASATDVFGESDAAGLTVALDVDGLRELRRLTAGLGGSARRRGRPGERK